MTTEPTDTVLVLTALEPEYIAVRDLIESPEVQGHAAGTRFATGSIRGRAGRVVLALVGVGNQSAAALAERAISRFQPRAVFFAGIAGALHDDLDLGAVVVGTKVYAYHGGFEESAGFSARPQAWDADHELEEIARAVSRDDSWHAGLPDAPAVHFRPIAAGEVVINSRDTALAEHLRRTYGDAAAVELESAGSAKAAQLNRTPFLTVRGISDKADGDKHKTDAKGWRSVAARNAAAFTIAVVTQVLLPSERKSLPPKAIAWSSLLRPVDVNWRTDLTGSRSAVERCAVELHIVPVDDFGRLEDHGLDLLRDMLPAHGRARLLFKGTDQLTTAVTSQVVWVRSAPSPYGHSGLAVHRTGQRTTWSPLPNDHLGSMLDRDDLAERIEQALRLLAEIPDLPTPASVALAAGLEPVAGLTEDDAHTPRRHAGSSRVAPHVRVLPADMVPFTTLLAHPAEVADEISARLHLAFQQAH
ncbi:5'-methylthioadenosine/S-adenosylhomocysteine nucleosidase [Lentzea waywayandensis]|uniref:5'-methylthioadenosine/S-adenosylhomocysteine nucleosidase n=1 Tax=Lentzea waywayandensis TaxID=84724 RepID=A0A1I6F4D9_9PSEU|nr:5'-methylthioadenosine/S-adenosylhomocysteine nucleosidase [Lentzea waywayandensis]SFR24816.1 5'-methylthioadenosine/S-adenosylhomocysteine nucleosidase [Lentzea waywayandensis]